MLQYSSIKTRKNKNMADDIEEWSILLVMKKSQDASVWFVYTFLEWNVWAFIPIWIGAKSWGYEFFKGCMYVALKKMQRGNDYISIYIF